MQVKIACHHNDGEIGRVFTVSDPELEKYQVCYFDRFIPQLEKVCSDLLDKFSACSTIKYLSIVVSCHGYNHHYAFKGGRIVAK